MKNEWYMIYDKKRKKFFAAEGSFNAVANILSFTLNFIDPENLVSTTSHKKFMNYLDECKIYIKQPLFDKVFATRMVNKMNRVGNEMVKVKGA